MIKLVFLLFAMQQFLCNGFGSRLGIRRLKGNFLKRNFAASSKFSHLKPNFPETRIDITPEEELLFEKFRTWSSQENLNVTLRVAGGWVRDRMLGLKDKPDIDFAIDTMTGAEFVQKINRFQSFKEEAPFSYNIIQLNPEKSKHLETGSLSFLFLFPVLVNCSLHFLF
jgi:hypothetical protein